MQEYASIPLLPREWPKIEMDLPINRELVDSIRILFYKYFGKESTDGWYIEVSIGPMLKNLGGRILTLNVENVSTGFMGKIYYVYCSFVEQNATNLSVKYNIKEVEIIRIY